MYLKMEKQAQKGNIPGGAAALPGPPLEASGNPRHPAPRGLSTDRLGGGQEGSPRFEGPGGGSPRNATLFALGSPSSVVDAERTVGIGV